MRGHSKALIKKRIRQSIECKQSILEDDELAKQIYETSKICARAIHFGGKVIFAGNGGSFADAQHLCAEFVSRLYTDRSPLPSITLGTNSSCVTAIANDYDYKYVFSRELECLGKSNDVLIGITTSGNSENILEAILMSKELGMKAIGLTSCKKGKITSLCDCLEVPSMYTTIVQESHIMIGHVLCELAEIELEALKAP